MEKPKNALMIVSLNKSHFFGGGSVMVWVVCMSISGQNKVCHHLRQSQCTETLK